MNALFLITETEFGKEVEFLDYLRTHENLSSARKVLKSQINMISSKEDAYETQPTMNFKDRFHFFIGKETRHMVISKYYKSERKSLVMRNEALEKLNDFTTIKK
jgi:hypothetical protein